MAFNSARLRQLRMEKGLSVYELSFQSGVEQATIHRLEKGVYKDPNFSTMERLADCLKVNMETFKKGKMF